MASPPALQPLQSAIHGSQNSDGWNGGKCRDGQCSSIHHFSPRHRAENKVNKAAERRIIRHLALSEHAFVERDEIVALRELNGGMRWIKRLDHDVSGRLATTGTPRNLGKKLEGPLPGPEIRDVKGHIGRYNAHERHIRKVKSL